mgnify:CR=1 FL=1
MGYDPRRAALLTLSLGALLLAASLMPAAGLGSFPGVDADADAPEIPDSGPSDTETPAVTTTPTPTPTATPEPTETVTPTPTPTETPSSSVPDDNQERDNETLAVLMGSLVWILVLAMFLSALYTAVVGLVVVGGGPAAAAKLPFGARIQALPQATMVTVIGLSGSLAQFARGLGDTVGAVTTGLGGLADVAGTAGRGLAALIVVPASVGRGFSFGFGSVFGSLSALASGSVTRTTTTTSGASTDARTASAVEPETPAEQAEQDQGPLSVREAWDLFTDELPVRRQYARTPTELRDRAIEQGWPAEPVESLTETFQEVRYGQRGETDARLGVARNAIEQLRPHWGDEK